MQYENDGNGKWRAYVDNHSKKKMFLRNNVGI